MAETTEALETDSPHGNGLCHLLALRTSGRCPHPALSVSLAINKQEWPSHWIFVGINNLIVAKYLKNKHFVKGLLLVYQHCLIKQAPFIRIL